MTRKQDRNARGVRLPVTLLNRCIASAEIQEHSVNAEYIRLLRLSAREVMHSRCEKFSEEYSKASKAISMRLPPDLYHLIDIAADRNNRSFSKEVAIRVHIALEAALIDTYFMVRPKPELQKNYRQCIKSLTAILKRSPEGVVIVGRSGIGKSTLAYFAHRHLNGIVQQRTLEVPALKDVVFLDEWDHHLLRNNEESVSLFISNCNALGKSVVILSQCSVALWPLENVKLIRQYEDTPRLIAAFEEKYEGQTLQ